ncbi:RNA polymerase subunit sigma-24 [Nocardioides sp. BGMRC 2183]|nr:RNA polymerase subunit sigma-24 [Nocardioides sp. BGMRC 2183]
MAGEDRLERLLREEWGRLLALLVAWCRRLDLAEDGLADAVEAAAREWPATDAPANPAGWLVTVARRRITDRLRSEAVLARAMPLLQVEAEVRDQAQQVMAALPEGHVVTDERLRLVLLCTHPMLSREAAAALALRLVLGVPTADIAQLFLVPVPTMAARLTRARRRLAGASFAVPPPAELTTRTVAVGDVAYLAFTQGYAPASGDDVLRPGLAADAIDLVRVLRTVLPREQQTAELDALLALMLLQHARRDARVLRGVLVRLPDQDRGRWRADEHAIAPVAAETDWSRIVARYDELLVLQDTPVVRLNRAVALAEHAGPEAGLSALDEVAMPGHRLPAARAEMLARLGRSQDAVRSLDGALALCRNEAEAALLRERRAALTG